MELSFFPFRIGALAVWAIHSSSENSEHMSGGVPGLVTTENNQSNQESSSLKTAQTSLHPVDLLPQRLYAYIPHFRTFKIINFSLRIGLIQRASVLTDPVPYSFHPVLQPMPSIWKDRPCGVVTNSARFLLEDWATIISCSKVLGNPGMWSHSVCKSVLCSLLRYWCSFPFLSFIWKHCALPSHLLRGLWTTV